jgi:hypothetical protein
LAAFQVITIGRIWVIPDKFEGATHRNGDTFRNRTSRAGRIYIPIARVFAPAASWLPHPDTFA